MVMLFMMVSSGGGRHVRGGLRLAEQQAAESAWKAIRARVEVQKRSEQRD